MKCQNCGKNEVNYRYTSIVNGVKKEIALCSKCASKMGVESFEMPEFLSDFNNFLGDFFNDYAESALLPSMHSDEIRCKKCGLTYNDFIKTGLFGCSECYNTFTNPVNSLLKNLHGTAKHIGRKATINGKAIESDTSKQTATKSTENNKEDDLRRKLDKAVSEERYEDAAKIKAEIDELKKKGSK